MKTTKVRNTFRKFLDFFRSIRFSNFNTFRIFRYWFIGNTFRVIYWKHEFFEWFIGNTFRIFRFFSLNFVWKWNFLDRKIPISKIFNWNFNENFRSKIWRFFDLKIFVGRFQNSLIMVLINRFGQNFVQNCVEFDGGDRGIKIQAKCVRGRFLQKKIWPLQKNIYFS